MRNLEKLQSLLTVGGVDALLLTSQVSRLYAARYDVAEGVALIGKDRCWYFTDSRYIEAAETNLQQFINGMFQQAEFTPRVVMTCDYTLRDQMVADGHGVSVTTQLGAQKSSVAGVVAIPLTFPAEKRKLGLVWRKKRVFSSSMEKFYDVANRFYSHMSRR